MNAKYKTTILVDGNALAYIINVNNFSTEKEYARAYFSKLTDYTRKLSPLSKIILCFDNKFGGTWREDLYSDYQKDRKASHQNSSVAQKEEQKRRHEYISYIEKRINDSKYMFLSYPHTESDDLISLYCKKIREQNEKVYILTTDKDLYQLIDDNTYIYNITKNKIIKDINEGKEILETKILLGDPSDSIPSVCRGVGKTYFSNFKMFLQLMKETNTDPTDKQKAKEVSENNNIKYINSFSNYNIEQHRLNENLVDLDYVIKNDEKENNIKTNYIKNNIDKLRFSAFSLYNIKLI